MCNPTCALLTATARALSKPQFRATPAVAKYLARPLEVTTRQRRQRTGDARLVTIRPLPGDQQTSGLRTNCPASRTEKPGGRMSK
eukprot:856138-Pyramimonas_sp.AAC.1